MHRIIVIVITCLAMCGAAYGFGFSCFDFGFGAAKKGLTCTDLLPNPNLSPASVAFGNISTGDTADEVVTLSNTGTAQLSAASLAVSGTGFSMYSTTCGANPFNLSAGSNCTATVRFSPETATDFTGALTMSAPNLDNVITALSGTGVGDGPAFCDSPGLFCEDFEGTDTLWTEASVTADCDGYDADGDYCDDDVVTFKNGAESFGIRGLSTSYVESALSTGAQSEFFIEFWLRISGTEAVVAGPAIVSSSGLNILSTGISYRTIRAVVKGGAVVLNTSTTNASANTWYHLGYYYKAETAAGDNNGVVRVWMNTDGGTFDAADVIYNSSTVDTGAVADGFVGSKIRLRGPSSGINSFTDDIKVTTGEPAWAY